MTLRSGSPAFGSLRVKTPPVLPGQRIGVMGGSFNPPHDGHLVVARTALRRLQLDQVWWLVTPGNPLKVHGGLAPLHERLAACRALADHPAMKITALEADLGTPYTAATLAFLKRRYSAARFVWVMGADNLAGFHRWQHWREIVGGFPIAVVDRPGWRLPALASIAARAFAGKRVPESRAASLPALPPPAWTFLTTRLSPLSSTDLRAEKSKQ